MVGDEQTAFSFFGFVLRFGPLEAGPSAVWTILVWTTS